MSVTQTRASLLQPSPTVVNTHILTPSRQKYTQTITSKHTFVHLDTLANTNICSRQFISHDQTSTHSHTLTSTHTHTSLHLHTPPNTTNCRQHTNSHILTSNTHWHPNVNANIHTPLYASKLDQQSSYVERKISLSFLLQCMYTNIAFFLHNM